MRPLTQPEIETVDIIYSHKRRNHHLMCWMVMREKDRRLTEAIGRLFG